jgi:AmmeMemoRadiSam system protein B
MNIDTENINNIYQSGPNVEYNSDAFITEHSFYNQLPFISHIINQLSSKNVYIIPIIVGTHSISSNVSKIIKDIINQQNTYTIISTNFNQIQTSTQLPSSIELKKMDLKVIDCIINKKYYELEKEFSVYGAKALILYDKLQKLVQGNLQLMIRKTSNDFVKDPHSIVSYLGLIIS